MSRRPPRTAPRAAHERVELVIDSLGGGGEGVGVVERDGERRAVFVAGVVPGERVVVHADFARRPARAVLLDVLAPSADRVTVACRDQRRCGSCDWMHLGEEAQAKAHEGIVRSVLPTGGDVPVRVHRAAPPLAYRARARVHVDGGRSGKVAVGMFARRSHEAVSVPSCAVLAAPVEALRLALPELLDGLRGRGEATISLAHPDASPRRAVLSLDLAGELPGAAFGALERATKTSLLAGARVQMAGAKVPALVGDPTPWIVGADGAPLRLAPGGFSQASEEGNAVLARHVDDVLREALGERGPDETSPAVLELFAGAGNLTVLFARHATVTAVEMNEAASAASRKNLDARGLTTKIAATDAAEFVKTKGRGFRAVVLDPPRTGARDVAAALAAKPVPVVVYVSCDPPTLGRDLGLLTAAGYRLRRVDAFEMFPQTSHVETVAVLTR